MRKFKFTFSEKFAQEKGVESIELRAFTARQALYRVSEFLMYDTGKDQLEEIALQTIDFEVTDHRYTDFDRARLFDEIISSS